MSSIGLMDLESYCISAHFVADIPVFSLADGTIHRWTDGHETIAAHSGLLAAVPTEDGAALITVGEDGRVCRTDPHGGLTELATVPRKWITSVAAGPGASFAFVVGRTAWLHDSTGAARAIPHASAIEDLVFSPDGTCVAIARYNGVSIHSIAGTSDSVELQWKGIQTGVTFSPDGRFLLMTTKENALHGWRLQDRQHMQMTGYPARIRDWSWSANGNWLATSGAHAAVLWQFKEWDGPIGKTPLELGIRGDSLVTAVCCHPRDDLVAVGYADGVILTARIDSEHEVMRRAVDDGEITSLAWDRAGARIAFGSERGACGVIDVSG